MVVMVGSKSHIYFVKVLLASQNCEYGPSKLAFVLYWIMWMCIFRKIWTGTSILWIESSCSQKLDLFCVSCRFWLYAGIIQLLINVNLVSKIIHICNPNWLANSDQKFAWNFNLIDMTTCDILETALWRKILFIQAKHQISDSISI